MRLFSSENLIKLGVYFAQINRLNWAIALFSLAALLHPELVAGSFRGRLV